jgi:hypothetical protein
VNFVDNLLLLSKSDRRRTIYNNNENNNHNDHNNHNNYNKQIMNTYGKGVLGKVAFSLFSPSSLLPFMTMAATLTTKPTYYLYIINFIIILLMKIIMTIQRRQSLTTVHAYKFYAYV